MHVRSTQYARSSFIESNQESNVYMDVLQNTVDVYMCTCMQIAPTLINFKAHIVQDYKFIRLN